MSLKSTMRNRFPSIWRVLRDAKWRCKQGVQKINSGRTQRAEQQYHMILDNYSREKDEFFFIQVGANDGVQYDPIRNNVEKYKWRGVLIEPQSDYFEKLLQNYAGFEGLHFENAAVSSTPDFVTLYRVRKDCITQKYQTGIATIVPQVGAISGLPADTLEEVKVPAVTLNHLLRKYAPSDWDLLQVDTEGYDYEVVKQIDFAGMYPRICCFEHRHLSHRDKRSCYDMLRQNGYVLYIMETDTAAVHSSVVQ